MFACCSTGRGRAGTLQAGGGAPPAPTAVAAQQQASSLAASFSASGQRLSDLRQQAAAAGVSPGALDDAIDCDQPKAALIKLLQGLASPAASAGAALRTELSRLKLSALSKRAATAGSPAAAVDEATDSDDPRAALMQLIVAAATGNPRPAGAGPGADVDRLSALGIATLHAEIADALDHCVEVLDQLCALAPRGRRKAVVLMLEKAETTAANLDVAQCGALKHCPVDDLQTFCATLAAVQKLQTSDGVELVDNADTVVGAFLSRWRQAVDPIQQAVLLLKRGTDRARAAEILVELELTPLPPEKRVVDEISMIPGLVSLLQHENAESDVAATRFTAAFALFTVGLRNGVPAALVMIDTDLTNEDGRVGRGQSRAVGGGRAGNAWMADIAVGALDMLMFALMGLAPAQIRIDLRTVLRTEHGVTPAKYKHELGQFAVAAWPERGGNAFRAAALFCLNMPLLASKYEAGLHQLVFVPDGIYCQALEQLQRVRQSAGDSVRWWLDTTERVTLAVAELTGLSMAAFHCPVYYLTEIPPQIERQWQMAVAAASSIVKSNASAGLSSQQTMPFWIIFTAFACMNHHLDKSTVDPELARVQLLESVLPAVTYACNASFAVDDGKISIAALAATVEVQLIGRNESGAQLSKPAADATLRMFAYYVSLSSSSGNSQSPAMGLAGIMKYLSSLLSMSMSDRHKHYIIERPDVWDALVFGLILGPNNARAGDDFALEVQHLCSQMFVQLSLSEPCAVVMRKQSNVIDGLRRLKTEGISQGARRCAQEALFQLEGRSAVLGAPAPEASAGGSENQTSRSAGKHVMVSYCWDQQEVIKRIHSALTARGYRVWIDFEQMRGSTVDSMAVAVENAEVILIGVSKQYKESTNCRLEANYSMQREVPAIPLMLVAGYQAEGWLGMLIGTRMWYGFYGSVLTEAGQFDAKMAELCRELGSRGHAVAEHTPSIKIAAMTSRQEAFSAGGTQAALQSELQQLKIRALRRRAAAAGVDTEDVEDALDSDDPKAALVLLVLGRHAEIGAMAEFLPALRRGGEDAATSLESVLEHAAEVLDWMSTSVARKQRKVFVRMLDEVEDAIERVDASWCDGLAQCSDADLECLGAALAGVNELQAGQVSDGAPVSSLLRCIQRCGSIVLQSVSVLTSVDSSRATTMSGIGGTNVDELARPVVGNAATERRVQLQTLGLLALQRRALADGVGEDLVEDAMDGDDPKTRLIDLITGSAADVDDAQVVRLREELRGLRVLALQKRAAAGGVTDAQLENALGSDEPKEHLIALIIDCHKFAASAEPKRVAALREELQSLKALALQRRAATAGVTDDQLETALDSNEPKAALIELLLSLPLAAAEQPPTKNSEDGSRPHFGSGDGGRSSGRGNDHAEPVKPACGTGKKHVMLSYQWDHQSKVKRVFDRLTAFGMNVWMDTQGGMSTDVYDSMAEGVSNAAVIAAFMSQKYQDSPNCMLELKFGRQSGIEIVPVMMEGSGWKATGWLGLLTAGSLWVPLHEEADFDDNVLQLHGQLMKIIKNSADASGEDEDEDGLNAATASSTEAIEELGRLREAQEAAASSQSTVVAAPPADTSQPATIPAGVPKLPVRFQATEQIRELTRLVLSTSERDLAMPRVGWYGGGGIGKTVTGAAIVRDDGVRQHFDAVVWLPLGQTPVIAKLQNLCHMQCTGKELSPELSSEEKKQALQQAMAGTRVLLCLDDLWEEDHEAELNFADVGAGSKVLISTRLKGLLAGGHQIEVGLPSASDSARMLLSAADADLTHGDRPSGVSEIVDLCGRLPLALGIAGRLAASLGLTRTQDWSAMIGVLKEELRESHSDGAEEGMIRASLRGLKGSAKERANVRSLLLLFAVVREDTHCPLEVMLLMFNAVNEGSGATIMHIRKYLRILIDRSLILGHIDTPQVHDLVLDWTVAQHSEEELRQKHRCIVEAFHAARPVDAHGRHKFDIAQKEHTLSAYACHEIQHHLECGWESNTRGDALSTDGWLADLAGHVPQDEIVFAAGRVLGVALVTRLAGAAEASRDWWLAARCWAVVQSIIQGDGNVGPTVKALDALAALGSRHESQEVDKEDFEDFELALVAALAHGFDATGDLARRPELVERVLSTQAAMRDPLSVGVIKFVVGVIPPMVEGYTEACGAQALETALFLLRAAEADPDPINKSKARAMAFNFGQFAMPLSHVDFSWDAVYGVEGQTLIAVFDEWDVDTMHPFLAKILTLDSLLTWATPCMALALHWANMDQVYRNLDRSMLSTKHIIPRALDDVQELNGIVLGAIAWPTFVWTCRLPADRCETVGNTYAEAGMTWSHAAEQVDRLATAVGWLRERGDKRHNAFHPAEILVGVAKCGAILMALNLSVSPEEIMADLPSVAEIIQNSSVTGAGCAFHDNHVFLNWFMSAGAVAAKPGRHREALEFATAGLVPEFVKAGTTLPQSRVVLMTMQANALAALGRKAEAGVIFNAAADEAGLVGLWLYQAFALRDLKVQILDEMGHGASDHGARCLGAVLRRLTGPAALLSPLLGGLDADELMTLPEPEPGYKLVFDGMTTDHQDLGASQLQGLRLSELTKRATSAGIAQDAIDFAMDSDSPKAQLIALFEFK